MKQWKNNNNKEIKKIKTLSADNSWFTVMLRGYIYNLETCKLKNLNLKRNLLLKVLNRDKELVDQKIWKSELKRES